MPRQRKQPFGGRVNGKIFTVQAHSSKMTVGKSTLTSTALPYNVNGCLYVSGYLFMELMDATVDHTAGRSGATLVTDLTIDAAASTTDGLTLPDNTFGDGSAQLTLSTKEQSACVNLFLADATGKDGGRKI